jgi:ABC-type branched-subunit amino acid transport system substrate-binding protein
LSGNKAGILLALLFICAVAKGQDNKLFPTVLKDKYTISVFLPLYLDSANREQNQKTAVNVSREFCKGLMIAADTLKHCGMKLDIHIFDSEKPWNFHSLEDTLLKNGTDLVIGPLLEGRIKWMDSISKKDKINYVSSLQPKESESANDYYFQSVPSPRCDGTTAAALIKKNYYGYKVFIINEKTSQGSALSETFVSQFAPGTITVLDCNGHGSKALPEKIAFSDSNVFLIPSRNEGFVSAVMSKLRVDSSKIVVFGPMQWQFFKTFEGDLWEKFKVHLLSPYFIDYDNPALYGFINRYRNRYNEDPTTWSFFGFDELVFYSNMMHDDGRYFQVSINNQNTEMLHTVYRIRKDSAGQGWQNEYINVLMFENYKFKRVAH